ncbi:MAG: RDD family protein [Nocardioides sp.]|uniref:RDD family protein n=1 Tax=Nocardioides sp. TaxID=35761 RepID=UPI0039E5AC4B
MTQAAAGWYPDPEPSASGLLRYWDGQGWTEHVSAPPSPTAQRSSTPYAGWWWRGLALLIDGAVVGVPGAIVELPGQIQFQRDVSGAVEEFSRQADSGATPDFGPLLDAYGNGLQQLVWWVLPAMLIAVAYQAIMLRWKGATLGKLALGVRVRRAEWIDASDGPLPWSTIALRVLAVYVPGAAFLLAIGSGSVVGAVLVWMVVSVYQLLDLLWAAWDPRRQTLHDKVADTVVVRGPGQPAQARLSGTP